MRRPSHRGVRKVGAELVAYLPKGRALSDDVWRLRHRTLSLPQAEASGAVVPIGGWVLDEACRQAVEWQSATRGTRPPWR